MVSAAQVAELGDFLERHEQLLRDNAKAQVR